MIPNDVAHEDFFLEYQCFPRKKDIFFCCAQLLVNENSCCFMYILNVTRVNTEEKCWKISAFENQPRGLISCYFCSINSIQWHYPVAKKRSFCCSLFYIKRKPTFWAHPIAVKIFKWTWKIPLVSDPPHNFYCIFFQMLSIVFPESCEITLHVVPPVVLHGQIPVNKSLYCFGFAYSGFDI